MLSSGLVHDRNRVIHVLCTGFHRAATCNDTLYNSPRYPANKAIFDSLLRPLGRQTDARLFLRTNENDATRHDTMPYDTIRYDTFVCLYDCVSTIARTISCLSVADKRPTARARGGREGGRTKRNWLPNHTSARQPTITKEALPQRER